MFEEVVGGLAVVAISGVVGFLLNSYFGKKEGYLPTVPSRNEKSAYDYINGNWHEYHFTYDPTMENEAALMHAIFEFTIKRDLTVVGKASIQPENRLKLQYLLRGEIRHGSLYFTMVCIEDPSNAVSSMYDNLLDDRIHGLTMGLDYEKHLFASPSYLCKNELGPDEAILSLTSSQYRFYQGSGLSNNAQ